MNTRKKGGLNFIRKMYHTNPFTFKKYKQLNIQYLVNNNQWEMIKIIKKIFDKISHDKTLLEKYIHMVNKFKSHPYELNDYLYNMPRNNKNTSIAEYINNFYHQYQINSLNSICGKWDSNYIEMYKKEKEKENKIFDDNYEEIIFDQLFMKTSSSRLFNIIYDNKPFARGSFNTVHRAHYRSYCNDKSTKIIVRVSIHKIPEFIESDTGNIIKQKKREMDEIVQSVKNSLLFMLYGIGPNVFNYGIKHNKLVYVLESYDMDLYDYLEKNRLNLIIWQQILKQIDSIITVIVDELNLFCIDIKPNNTLIRIDSNNNVKIVFIDADSDLCPTNNYINANDKKIHKHLLLLMYNMHFSDFLYYENEKIIKFTDDNILMVNNYIITHHLIECMKLYIENTKHYFDEINEKKVGKMYTEIITSPHNYIQFNRFFWVNK